MTTRLEHALCANCGQRIHRRHWNNGVEAGRTFWGHDTQQMVENRCIGPNGEGSAAPFPTSEHTLTDEIWRKAFKD